MAATDTESSPLFLIGPHQELPLDLYTDLYGVDLARDLMTMFAMPVWSRDNRGYELALESIRMLAAFGQYHVPELSSFPTGLVRKILFYSYWPGDYLHFESSMMISGCIKVMSAAYLSSNESSLSYELGYTCIRIIALGLGVCLVRKGQDLGLDQTTGLKGLDLHEMSLRINHLVYRLVSSTGGGEDWDGCILGWACERRPVCPVIISLEDAETLLTLLYKHRGTFLRVMRFTYSPGLSTVMFALWRYILFQRPLNDQSLAKERLDLFQEIFWRCWIVAMHEQDLFRHMASRIQDLWQWPNMEQSVIPIPIDLQDSTELIAAFIDRLTPPTDDTSVYDSLSLVDLINCIAFVQQRTLPGAGELLPKCFGAIIERLWYTISHLKESSARIGEVLGTVFTWFRGIEELFQPPSDTSPELLTLLIDEMIRTDFLSLVGRTIFVLNPFMDQVRNSPDFAKNAKFLRGTGGLFENISKVAPTQVLADRFKSQGVDWWKVNDHIERLALIVLSSEGPRPDGKVPPQARFYDVCSGVWKAVGECIQYTVENIQYAQVCGYRRCPDPIIIEGAVHKCSKCRRIQYCSARCQGLDWMFGHATQPHREVCLAHTS